MNEIQQTRRRLDSAEKVEKIPKESYGLAMGQLKSWRDERKTKLLDKESTKQGIAVGKVIGFLNAIGMAVKLQTWFRMVSVRQRYYEVLAHRRGIKYAFLRAWKINHKVDLLFRFHTLGKFYLAWKGEMTDSKRLKKLIHEFFKICIKRLRLTPQACMAYFNPGEWTKDVTHSDMMKIRRLMLMKLLQGWKAETRELRIVRAKATQVLSRMVRRTKGPLWVKESSLVCFHMWHRYTAVKRAYRLEEPDPRFQNPYLPQWTKLFKEITLSRVKKKRSLEAGHRLTEGRSFRVWKHLMSVDRSKPVTPLAVAIMHYSRVIRHKILLAWYGVVRERGKLIRFRNDIFGRWKKWAPQNKKLWEFNGKALLWLRLKQMRRAYNVMVDLCLDVISKRTERMKVLRRNFCDRKVVICAYALMNKNEHVLFVDCWRRLHHYWQCRRNWKAYKMHHKYHWHMTKVKEIFHAWKTHVAVKKDLKNSSIPAMRELFARPQFTSHGGALANDEIQTDDQSCDDNSSVGSYGGAGHTYLTEFPGSPGGVGSWDASSSPHHHMSGNNTGNNTPKTRGGTSGGGQMRSRAGTTREKKRLRRAPPVIDYQNLVNGYVPVGYDLIQQAMEGTLSVVPNESQFQLFCLAITQSQNRILAAGAGAGAGAGAASGQSNTAATAATVNKPSTAGSVAQGTASTTGTRQSFVAADTTALLKQLNAPVVEPPPVISTTGTKARGNSDVSINTLVYSPALQQKLQRGIDEMDMTTVLSAVSEGATIEPRHVKQVAIHIGDQYLPLFALLLTGSTQFMAERVVKRDGNPVLNTVQNPINAFLLGSQVDRWTHNELTRREVTALTENKSLQDTMAGPYATISIWHNIVLKIIDIRAEQLALTCKILPEARTVDEEVVEVLKRKKIERLNAVHASLSSMFGLTVPETDRRATIPALVVTAIVPHTGPMRKSQLHIEQHQERDIYTVLREFTLMTGKLTNEGKALRGPLLERDQTLIVNGFLKQARADFLALRRSCMTPAQLAAEAEKLAKAELKAKKLAEKGKKKPKKKKKSKKGGKKKAKKSAIGGAGNRPRSASSGSDTDGSGTDDDDEYNTSGASSADESSEAISVRYNDYYYDGQFLHSANEIENLPEESDILLEKEYQKRVSAFQSPVYTETWLPMYSRHNVESTLVTLVERYTKEMKCVVKRVVDILQCDENIGKFDFPEARALFGGIGQYIIDKGAGDAKCRSAASWAVMPKDWWSFKLIKSRLNRELAVVEGTMVSTKKKISTHNDKNDELEEEAEGYEKYLKKIRKEILKISQKRNEKTAYDKVQRSAKAAMLKKAERNIVTSKSKLTTLTEKLRLAEIYFAAGNARGVIDLLKPPPPPETAADTASNAGKDTKKDAKDGTKDSKKDPKKSKPKGKKGEADDGGDSDGSEDSISIYGLLEDAKNQLAALKESLPVLETKRFKLDCELRDYDNACYRTTKMLKTLAEDRFNTMVEVQSLVIRTNKNYDICEENKEVYSKARKRALKYFKQLKAFHDLKLQARGNQLAREAEARRLSELMRRPDGLGTRQSSSNSLVGGPDTPTRKQRGTFLGEDSPSGRPVAARFNPNQSTASNSLEGLNILPDIVVTEEELEAYNAGRMSPESVDTGGSFDYDDLEAPDMTSEHQGDDAQRPNRPNRKHDDLNASNGSHNNSHESLNVGEYRPLTIDEEILLLHHNSIENRKRREEDLKRAALLQAEEALAQELKMKVFDDYWTALPRKHDNDDMSNANHDSPRKKERNARKSVVEPVSPTKVDPAAVTKILSKTAKMWASVGKQYWRTKEETIKSLVENEILNSASDDDDGNNNDNIRLESQDDYDLAGVSRTDHILAQRKAKLQAEILAKKVDLFEENVYIDTRKDTDLQEPDAQTGLPYKVSHDFAHMSDAVWKVSTPIIMPTIPGKGAPIVPTLSVSIRELLERRGSTDGSVVTELKPPADDSQPVVPTTRSRGNSRQGTKKSLLKDKEEGEGDDDDGSKDGTGSATSATAAKVDQFSTVGRLEYLRYKAGMQSKAALAMADDDVASYSVESRTGSIDSVVRRNTEKIANIERIGGFGGDTGGIVGGVGIAEHGFAPQSVGALIDGGYVVPALIADENAFAGDDMSEMSIQSSVVSQSSSVANQRHQRQVDQYLNLIEQPHEISNIGAENVNIISGETPQQVSDKQQFGETVHISAEQSVASSKSASQVKSETTPPPQPPQPLEKVEPKQQNASSLQTAERAQTTPLKTKTSPEKFNKSVTKSTEKPTTRATISAGNMSAMAQTAAGVANKTQKLVRFGTEGGTSKDKDTPVTLSPTKGTSSSIQKSGSNSSSSLPSPLNRSSSAPIRHTIQATHPSNQQQQQTSSPKIISSPKVVIKSIMKDSLASGQLKSQSPQQATNSGIFQERSVSLPADDETSEISMEENLETAAMWAEQEGSFPASPMAVQIMRQDSQESESNEVDSLPSIQISINNRGSPLIGRKVSQSSTEKSGHLLQSALVNNNSNNPADGNTSEVPSVHLERVRKAADQSRTSIKVKRNGPVHNAHEQFLPSSYPPESQLELINASPDRALSKSGLRIDTTVAAREQQQEMGEGDGTALTTYLEMPAVLDLADLNNNATQQDKKVKKRLIFSDSPMSARLPHHSNHTNNNSNLSFESANIPPSAQHPMDVNGKYLAVSVNGQWQLQSPPKTHGHGHTIAGNTIGGSTNAHSIASTRHASPLKADPSGVSSAEHSPRPEFMVSGTKLLRAEEGLGEDSLDSALGDHDLLDVDSVVGNRLASRLGLRPSVSPPRDRRASGGALNLSVPLLNVDGSVASEDDLSYDNLLNLVKEFKTEQKLLRDREVAIVQETPTVSFYPANFRQHLMIPKKPEVAESLTVNTTTHAGNSNAGLSATAKVDRSNVSTPVKTPSKKRNRNLTRSFDKHVLTVPTTPDKDSQGVAAAANLAHTLSTTNNNTSTSAGTTQSSEVAVRKEGILSRKNTSQGGNATSSGNMNNNNSNNNSNNSSSSSHFNKADVEKALTKYMTQHYTNLDPNDIHGDPLSEVDIQAAADSIRQYLHNQEEAAHVPPHSPGSLSRLHSRQLAREYRTALSFDSTLEGQGGMFFKDEHALSPSNTAPLGSNHYRDSRHSRGANSVSPHRNHNISSPGYFPSGGHFNAGQYHIDHTGTGGSHTADGTYTAGSSVELKRAGSAQFWVEVIKLLHPENEHFDDEDSSLATEPRSKTPRQVSRPQFNANVVPDMSVDVIKLSHPQLDTIYGNENRTASPGTGFAGKREMNRSGSLTGSRTGAPESFAAGLQGMVSAAQLHNHDTLNERQHKLRNSASEQLVPPNYVVEENLDQGQSHGDKLAYSHSDGQLLHLAPVVQQAKRWPAPATIAAQQAAESRLRSSQSRLARNMDRSTSPPHNIDNNETNLQLSARDAHGNYIGSRAQSPGSPKNLTARETVTSPGGTVYNLGYNDDSRPISPGSPSQRVAKQNTYGLSDGFRLTTLATTHYKFDGDAPSTDTIPLPPDNVLVGTAATMSPSPAGSRPQTPSGGAILRKQYSATRVLGGTEESVGGRPVSGSPIARANLKRLGTNSKIPPINELGAGPQPDEASVQTTSGQFNDSHLVDSGLVEHSLASVQIISEIAGEFYNVNNSLSNGGSQILQQQALQAPQSPTKQQAQQPLSGTSKPHLHPLDTNSLDNVSTNISAAGSPFLSGFNNSTANSSVVFNNNLNSNSNSLLFNTNSAYNVNSSFSAPIFEGLKVQPLAPPAPDNVSIYSKNSLNEAQKILALNTDHVKVDHTNNNNNLTRSNSNNNNISRSPPRSPLHSRKQSTSHNTNITQNNSHSNNNISRDYLLASPPRSPQAHAKKTTKHNKTHTTAYNSEIGAAGLADLITITKSSAQQQNTHSVGSLFYPSDQEGQLHNVADGDDNSSIHTTRSAILKSNYLANANNNSNKNKTMTLDDYMRMKERQVQYHTTEDGDKNISSGTDVPQHLQKGSINQPHDSSELGVVSLQAAKRRLQVSSSGGAKTDTYDDSAMNSALNSALNSARTAEQEQTIIRKPVVKVQNLSAPNSLELNINGTAKPPAVKVPNSSGHIAHGQHPSAQQEEDEVSLMSQLGPQEPQMTEEEAEALMERELRAMLKSAPKSEETTQYLNSAAPFTSANKLHLAGSQNVPFLAGNGGVNMHNSTAKKDRNHERKGKIAPSSLHSSQSQSKLVQLPPLNNANITPPTSAGSVGTVYRGLGDVLHSQKLLKPLKKNALHSNPELNELLYAKTSNSMASMGGSGRGFGLGSGLPPTHGLTMSALPSDYSGSSGNINVTGNSNSRNSRINSVTSILSQNSMRSMKETMPVTPTVEFKNKKKPLL